MANWLPASPACATRVPRFGFRETVRSTRSSSPRASRDGFVSNGVKICLDEEVLGIATAPVAITTSAGRTAAGSILVAAGAWTPLLTRMLGWHPPIRPIRGTLLATREQPAGMLRSIVIGPPLLLLAARLRLAGRGGLGRGRGFQQRIR